MALLIKIVELVLSLIMFLMILRLYLVSRDRHRAIQSRWKLAITGVIAYICDALGISSFAVIVAFDQLWSLIDDQLLPGTLNSQAILPAMVESLFFLETIHVNTKMLLILTIAATIGGFIGGAVVSRLNRQIIRLTMGIAFIFMALLILANQLHLIPIGGEKTLLTGMPLIVAFFAVVLISSLPALGVGISTPIQALFFILGLSPLIAFPVMSTASAFQQITTTLPFLFNRRIALKEVFAMTFFSCLGVMIAAPLITHIKLDNLRWLLFFIVVYNIFMLFRAYRHKSSG